MKCFINGTEVNAKVVENMGYQNGHFVKAVAYGGNEHIVIKVGRIWKNVSIIMGIHPTGTAKGQSNG
jgi:hypothetical protein